MRVKTKYKWLTQLFCGVCCAWMLTGCGAKKTDATEAVTTQQAVTNATATDASGQTETLPMDADGFYITNDYVKTIGETINVRVSPSKDADIYKLLPGGEVLNRTGFRGNQAGRFYRKCRNNTWN